MPEMAAVVGAGQNSVNLRHDPWNGTAGVLTEGLTILRGTSPGVYTRRYDVLPKAGRRSFAYRADTATWVDLGDSVAISAESALFFPDWPITYPTIDPMLTATDETGLEMDANYKVFTMPPAQSITKRVDGFAATFGVAVTSFDWLLVR